MPASYRKLQVGLRLSSVGLWVVATAAVLMVSLSLLAQLMDDRYAYHFRDSEPPGAIVERMCEACVPVCGLLVLLGAVVGYAARRFCMNGPAIPAATARLGLAVLFEASSLLSTAGFAVVVILKPPVPSYLPPTWVLFIALMAYLARVQFLRFARTLAERLAPALVPQAAAVQRLYLYVPGGFLLAYGVAAAGTVFTSKTDGNAVEAVAILGGWLIATAAASFGLFMVWRWSELLAGLRKAATHADKFDDAEVDDADDPDREYRDRYFASGGSPSESP